MRNIKCFITGLAGFSIAFLMEFTVALLAGLLITFVTNIMLFGLLTKAGDYAAVLVAINAMMYLGIRIFMGSEIFSVSRRVRFATIAFVDIMIVLMNWAIVSWHPGYIVWATGGQFELNSTMTALYVATIVVLSLAVVFKNRREGGNVYFLKKSVN